MVSIETVMLDKFQIEGIIQVKTKIDHTQRLEREITRMTVLEIIRITAIEFIQTTVPKISKTAIIKTKIMDYEKKLKIIKRNKNALITDLFEIFLDHNNEVIYRVPTDIIKLKETTHQNISDIKINPKPLLNPQKMKTINTPDF